MRIPGTLIVSKGMTKSPISSRREIGLAYTGFNDWGVITSLGRLGRRNGCTPITTLHANVPDCRTDLVNRDFTASAPYRLWLVDITYMRTRSAFAYTAFTTYVNSLKIVGVATRASMRTAFEGV